MSRKWMALVLSVAMVITMIPFGAFAETTTFSDMPENWSTQALQSAVDNGLLTGYDGKIMPNEKLTRAQMATIVNRAFGAVNQASLTGFTDVISTDWFYPEMAKAVAMGTFQGSGNKLNPNAPITREEAFAVVSRALKLGASETVPSGYTDLGTISDWAKGEVYSLINNGYIKGSNGMLNPKGQITRAEFAQVMFNIIKGYISTAGEHTLTVDGNLIINVPGVTLKGSTITGDLIIGDGVGDGEIFLEDTVVEGRLLVRGGGKDSIVISGNSSIRSIIIAKVDGVVRVFAEDGTEVGEVIVDGKDDVILEGEFADIVATAPDITVWATNATIDTATIEGTDSTVVIGANTTVEKLVLSGSNTEAEVTGTVKTVETTAAATDAVITVTKDGTIDSVVINSTGTTVAGAGEVKTVEAKANDVIVTTEGTKVTASEGTTGVIAGDEPVEAGKTVEVPKEPVSIGGGGGGEETTTPLVVGVSAISVEPETLTLTVGDTETITATVEPEDATNQEITWTSSDENVATVDANGKVTAVAAGQVIITVTTVDGEFTDTVQVAIGNVINITRNKGYQTIQEATEEIKDGDTLKLIADISTDTGISINRNIIFDLNGMTITSNWNANEEGNENAIAIVVKSTVTVKNGTIITNKGSGGIQADGVSANLTLEALTIDQNGLNTKKIYNSTAVLAANEAKVTIISGDYTAETDAVLVKANGGTVIIEDGIFTAGRSAARNDAWGEPTHSLTINGGTFNAEKEEDSYALFSAGGNAETTVNGGIFNGEINSEYNHMIINDGTFNQTIFQGGGHQDYYIIYGGTFVDDLSGTLPENTKLIRAINTTDDKGYETIQEAIDKASKGDTITLLADASGDGVIVPENSSFTLDLNGKTYTVDGTLVGSTGTETNGFQLLKGSTITIKNGTITTPNVTGAKILIQNYSNLTLDNVDLVGADVTQYVLSNNNGSTKLESGTTITAAEGDVAFDVYYWPGNGYESVTVEIASNDVAITGRVEYASDGGEGFATNAKLIIPADYELTAPTGYKWVAQDGKQVLIDASTVAMIGPTQYNTLQAAITEAKSDDTINILSDVSFVGVNANGKNLTFMGTNAKPIISFPEVGVQKHYNSEFTFKNLTLDFAATGYYHGIQPAKLTVENSVINGILWGYADDIIVTDSVFNQNTNGYNMWTYGSNVTIERSEFNSLGRSLLIYNEGHGQQPAKIVIIDSTFNASEKYDEKAAIEIDASLGKFDVEIKNTTATGFDTKTEDGGIVLSEELVNLKKAAKAEGNLTVSIDDVVVYPNAE